MNKVTRQLLEWVQQDALPPKNLAEALKISQALPSAKQQNQFLQWLLLISGVLMLVSGVIFFFAFNWNNLHRFSKLAIAQIFFLSCLLPLYKAKMSGAVAQLALAAASLLLGACLALVGQIYQTGANTYQLFLIWALSVLPWLALTQHVFIAGLFILLANLAWLFYSNSFSISSSLNSIWLLFIINLFCLVALELYSRWRDPFGLNWLVSALFGWVILFTTTNQIDNNNFANNFLLAWAALLALSYYWYRYVNLNLLRLSIIFLAISSYITAKAAYYLSVSFFLDWSSMLFLGVFFFGSNLLAAKYLRGLHTSKEEYEL